MRMVVQAALLRGSAFLYNAPAPCFPLSGQTMRQTRLITALLVMVCACAVLVWYFLDLSSTNVHAPGLQNQ